MIAKISLALLIFLSPFNQKYSQAFAEGEAASDLLDRITAIVNEGSASTSTLPSAYIDLITSRLGLVTPYSQEQISKLNALGVFVKQAQQEEKENDFPKDGRSLVSRFPDRREYFRIVNPQVFDALKEASRRGIGIDHFIDKWRVYKLTFDFAEHQIEYNVVATLGAPDPILGELSIDSEGHGIGNFFKGASLYLHNPTQFYLDFNFLFLSKRFFLQKLKALGWHRVDAVLKNFDTDYFIYLVMLAMGYDPSISNKNTDYFRKMSEDETIRVWRAEFDRNLRPRGRHQRHTSSSQAIPDLAQKNSREDVQSEAEEAERYRAAYVKIGKALEHLSQRGDILLVDPEKYYTTEQIGDSLPKGLMWAADFNNNKKRLDLLDSLRNNSDSRRSFTPAPFVTLVDGIDVESRALAGAVAVVFDSERWAKARGAGEPPSSSGSGSASLPPL